ncbi:DNA repair protein XRCC1 [Drosophila grimshawi]|uniref:GH24614 n=1 Tax=Drosophila grimshawi TaxID=7222 RepID=B4JMB7_DROGR|nr:DNA repair protein XRCC1 [Drosophila grimshawi]EDV91878.1 GH24614 [Drosophila grimshawi]
MPIGVFKSVREVSSEDTVHVAANLLQQNAAKKWKTQGNGEKCAYVILEFEEAQQITGIDIGNEHAAFIEVLVSKTGCQLADFKELLLSSSFMTPIESKNSSNLNRVRCFSGEALNPATLAEKWKLVKIVCTQPFNKHVQYGLSFIKPHVSGAAKPKSLLPDRLKNNLLTAGGGGGLAFKLREESPDSEPDGKASLSLFQRWKATRNDDNDAKAAVSTAAAIRDAGSPAALRRRSDARSTLSSIIKVADAPASASVSEATSSKTETKSRSAKQLQEKDHKLDKQKPKTAMSTATKESPRATVVSAPKRMSSSSEDTPSKPAKKQKTLIEKPTQYVPFDQLLRGVVLVISGIQNPDRADLRSKALALGATYKADWESGCTHLICAFRNTPKYNQVRGKGKIVTRNWIEKCYALKKYLPWRRYALDTNEVGQPESDEEVFDESLKPIVMDKADAASDVDKDVKMVVAAVDTNIEDMLLHGHSSGPDTEDELERVAQQNKLKKMCNTKQSSSKENILNDSNKNKIVENDSKSSDIYEVSTDEEDYLKELQNELQ